MSDAQFKNSGEGRKGVGLRIGERREPGLGFPVCGDLSNISVSCYGCDSSEQGSEDSRAAHG